MGSALAVGLTVNAYFLRGISQDLNILKVELAILATRSAADQKRMLSIEESFREFQRDINNRVGRNSSNLHEIRTAIQKNAFKIEAMKSNVRGNA